ncbi:uncharacterized protein EI90DRAFT_2669785 [Cantharellus anzutake]|uniref:uncharacterized protein n=1 Tax=Cantharellus anzutake TaxID=1750568 RepID=UPI001905691B|nr:uncharacterized protein EI90DRAFT_2669785 [Cantharellus anzutake]KAF8337596.1 hypothetical protein EI90DRAFT_2669785 [Cantharellus anzutake]
MCPFLLYWPGEVFKKNMFSRFFPHFRIVFNIIILFLRLLDFPRSLPWICRCGFLLFYFTVFSVVQRTSLFPDVLDLIISAFCPWTINQSTLRQIYCGHFFVFHVGV